MIQTQPLEISDFSLGITDYFFDGNPRAAEEIDNFFLTPNGKIRTRWGSIIFQDQLPLGISRVNKLSKLENVVLAFQDKRIYRPTTTTWTEIQGPSGGALMQLGDGNSVIIEAEWQDHLFFTSDAMGSPQKIYVDSTNAYRAVNAGLPEIADTMTFTIGSGTNSYLYAFHYVRTYTVGNITYLDQGPVTYHASPIIGKTINATDTVAIATIPAAVPAVENYDTANMKIQIYRTTAGGSVFYQLNPGEINYGTTTYTDNTTDADLLNRPALYTTGGIASNGTPPKAKYVHVVNNFGYWAHITEGAEVDSSLIRQSKFNDPDSVPEEFFVNAEQPITGLSSIYDRPLVFCNQYVYRIDNFFADDGTGGMILRRIDDYAGCLSAQSLVQTHVGLFWAGALGFYWTDGFRVVCISNHLNKTYQQITSSPTKSKNIVGTFDPANQRVIWTASKNDNTGEADMCFVLDLRYPFTPTQENIGGSFTTMSDKNETNFKPSQIMALGDSFYRADPRGYVFQHKESYITDPVIDTTALPSAWNTTTIIHSYKSCFLDFGSKFMRKWVPRILVSAENTTNVSIAISSSNDNDRVLGTLKPIIYQGNIVWGSNYPLWGDPNVIWNKQNIVEEWRRFPAGGLRCNYKQVGISNAYIDIFSSNFLAEATVTTATKTAVLAGQNWPIEIVDYYISFENDNFTKDFLITSRTNTTITYSDPTNIGPSLDTDYKWIIRGKPKGEVLQLNAYVLHWAYLSKSHTPYTATGTSP